jgi:hypothetical protein
VSAPAGRPTADRRPVRVGGIDFYLDRDHVAIECTVPEAAVILHALHELRADEGPTPLSLADRQALTRAIARVTDTVARQVNRPTAATGPRRTA